MEESESDHDGAAGNRFWSAIGMVIGEVILPPPEGLVRYECPGFYGSFFCRCHASVMTCNDG
jgi:hypothetical protein